MAQSLELQISDNAQAAAENINHLASAMNRLHQAASGNGALQNFVEQIRAFGTALNSTDSPVSQLVDSITTLNGSVQELQSVLAGINGRMSGFAAEANNAGSAVAGVAQEIDGTLSGMTEISSTIEQTAEGTQEFSNVANNAAEGTVMLEQATETASAAMETLANSTGGVSDILSSTMNDFNAFGTVIEAVTARLANLAHQFMRVLRFRIFRAIIRAITNAFREGLQNVRQYSEAINGLYAKDMAELDNAILKMNNSLGAALAPAIQALLPLLHWLIDGLINAANAFNQFFAAIQGHSTWTKAVDVVASDFEDVKKSAIGAAKATKNLLADWDELNIIQSQAAGGGSGSGKNQIDYTKMFEESEFDGWASGVKDSLGVILGLAAGIGAAFLTWRISSILGLSLSDTLKYVLGIGLAVFGLVTLWKSLSDQLENGVNWDNLTQSMLGVAGVVAGLAILFGLTGAAVGMLIGAVVLAIAPIKELIETGKMCDESLAQLSIAIALIGGAVSLLTGSWIPLLIAGIVIAIAWVVQKWDKIKEWAAGVWNSITTWFSERWDAISGWVVQAWADVKAWFASLWLGITLWATGVWASITAWFTGVWNSVSEWWNTTVVPGFNQFTEWIDTNVTQRIAGFFETLGQGMQDFLDDPIGSIKSAWLGMAVWFANNITIPIENFFIDCINGILSAINWVIDRLNTLNFTIPGIEGIYDDITVGVSGLQKLELLPHVEQLDQALLESALGMATDIGADVEVNVSGGMTGMQRHGGRTGFDVGRSGTVVGVGSGEPIVIDLEVVGTTTHTGGTDEDDPQIADLSRKVDQITNIMRIIQQKDFTVRITPSASLGRVVSESETQWRRTSGTIAAQ